MRSQTAHLYVTPDREEWRYLPEGPRRMTVRGRETIAWVDIQTGKEAKFGMIFARPTEGGDEIQITCPGRPGFILPVEGGDRVLVGLDKELKVCNLATGEWSESLARIPDHSPRTMMNDAEIVPGGKAVVFGTKEIQVKEPLAHLYLFTVDDHQVSVLADRQTCSNGKVMYPDERGGFTLFDIDTPTRKVARYRLDVAARTATLEGVAVDLSHETGLPDGMRDCGDGTAIIALYNPEFAQEGRAVRYNLSTGQALEEWRTPLSPRVTCPSVEGSQVILTTAVEGMPPEQRATCSNAGCLFIGEVHPPSKRGIEVVKL
jgi:sugar lactone lactonase YvrE